MGGNILSRTEYAYTLADIEKLTDGRVFTYEYNTTGWKDQLRSYDGAECSYDPIGNPMVYRNSTLTWSHCRQLDQISGVNQQIAKFAYNASGIRIAKQIGTVKTEYYLDGTTILAQKCGNQTVYFNYGIDGIDGFTYNSKEYYYRKNIQGDILAILDENGTEIVQYVYDAWGNHNTYVLSENNTYLDISKVTSNEHVAIAQLNPYRYRGYYYDIETKLYYLNTRYYDPEVGRFINADDVSKVDSKQINGLNLYAYCFDNPIYNIDPTGHKGKWWQWLLVGVLAVASVALIGFGVGAAFAAAATVATTATTLTVVASVSVGMGVGGLVGLATSIDDQGGFSNADPVQVIQDIGSGAIAGGVIGFLSATMSSIGAGAGSVLGFNLGNMTHIASGIKVGSIISTSTLMRSFAFVGGIAGGLAGSMFGNYIVNLVSGNSASTDEYTKKSAEDELPMWIINILRWLFG